MNAYGKCKWCEKEGSLRKISPYVCQIEGIDGINDLICENCYDNYLHLRHLGSINNITICRFCDERIDGQINHEDCLDEMDAESLGLLK